MKEIKIEVATAKIDEIRIENKEKAKLIVRLSLYDYADEYVGSITIDSTKAMENDFSLSQDIADAIASLFISIENQISEHKTILV